MDLILQGVATLIALVNPAMCLALFARGTANEPASKRVRDAVTAVAAISAILSIAAFAGIQILDLFGVSLSAFSVAGGAVLVAIGAQMMTASKKVDGEEAGPAENSLLPLILFAASPGTITGVITISVANRSGPLPVTALISIAAVMLVLLATLLFAAKRGSKKKSGSMARTIVTSYMGLIVIAMGVQFALSGWRDFMAT